jgi:hypothetical protein
VLVIPDLAGTGMSRKVLDALALGACFASTAAGMRDIDLGRSGYRPSMDAKDLAEDIEHLLASPAARSERSRVALELYELNVSEVAYYRAWDSILETVVPGLPLRPGLGPDAGNPSLIASEADHSISSAQRDSRWGLR